jgi:hypothetical protein
MAANKSRKATAPKPEPTARPRPISEELPAGAFAEEGLSVDPEDLGAQFLIGATEQNNFESLRPADTAELSVASGGASDEPLVGPNMDVDRTPWEQTVDLTLQSGSREPPTLEAASESDTDDEDDEATEPRGVNLLGSAIREGSLLDEEGDEPGETEAPSSNTDDSVPNGVRDRTL